MTYEEIYRDWSYLWRIGPATDMTGGYVDQEDLAKLLANPSKKTAKECLRDQIIYWLQEGPDMFGRCKASDAQIALQRFLIYNERVQKIAQKYIGGV